MQNDVHRLTCPAACVGIDDVGFQKLVPPPLLVANGLAYLVQVMAVPGLEVIDTDDILSEAQQCFEQMRTDEPRASGHQPAQGLGAELQDRCPQGDRLARGEGHQSLHTWMPCARSAAASARHFTSTYTPLGTSFATNASAEYCS